MRIRKYYLGLTIMIGILCVPAHGEVERPSMENMPLLVGQPEPALRGIRQLYIVILPPDAEPNKDGLVWNDLEKAVEGQISQAGIKIAEAIRREHTLRSLAIPELRININMLKIEEPNQYIFHTETSLAKKVYLTGNFSQHLKVDVWKAEPAMQAVSAQGMPAAVTSAVLEQVEAFTHAHHAANPQHKRPSDVNDVNEESKEQAEPAAESTPASQQGEPTENKYVSSKNGKVFHTHDCIWVKRIKPENLTYYNSRDEAINAGKRPCKQCNP